MDYDTGKLFEQVIEHLERHGKQLDWLIKRLAPPKKEATPDENVKEIFKESEGETL